MTFLQARFSNVPLNASSQRTWHNERNWRNVPITDVFVERLEVGKISAPTKFLADRT